MALRIHVDGTGLIARVALMVLAWIAPSASSAQVRPTVLADRPCAECSIWVDSMFSFGDVDGPGAIGNVYGVTRDVRGRYLVVHTPDAFHIGVFEPDGQPLDRVGRRGQGPGEFRFIRWMNAAGRSVLVFDGGLQRVSVLDEDLSVKRTFSVEIPLRYTLADMESFGDSLVVVNAALHSPDRVGFTLHALDASGKVVSSFAEDADGFQMNAPETLWMRQLARSSEPGDLWAAHVTEYAIQRWSTGGTLRESLVRNVAWFPPHTGAYRLDPQSPMYLPQIEDIKEDDSGLLWLLIRVPSENWTNAIVPLRRDGVIVPDRWTIEDQHAAFDSLIEVIDPRSKSVIARYRSLTLFNAFVGTDQLASYSTGSDLHPKVTIWKVGMRGAN